MTKTTLSILALAISSTLSSQAITVTIAKGTGAGLTVLDTTNAPQATFRIAVGTFDAAPNVDLTGFNEFGAATSGTNLVTSSFNSGAFGVGLYPAAEKFNARSIFIVVTNNAGTERAILGRGTSASNDWLFPADVTPALAATESLDTNNATRVAVVNGVGAITDNVSGVDNVKLVSIVPVPEPSGVMLLSFIAMGGLIRRRR